MKKWWGWILLVLVVMAVGGYYVWNNFNKQSESVLPSELNEDFDPTVNEPRFFALGLGSKQNSLSLEYTFPYSMEGKRIESVLICDKGLKLKERGQEEARDVEMNYALTKIVPENMPILFFGLCQDKYCTTIIGTCNIYLN